MTQEVSLKIANIHTSNMCILNNLVHRHKDLFLSRKVEVTYTHFDAFSPTPAKPAFFIELSAHSSSIVNFEMCFQPNIQHCIAASNSNWKQAVNNV